MTVPVENDVSSWTYMPWVDEYVMQNKRLTKEHYRLVYLTNLIYHLLDESNKDTAREVFIKEVVPLAKRHLRFEILVMNTIDFRHINQQHYEQHCQAHAKLEQGIDEISAKIHQTDMAEVASFLRDWLDNHIRVEDSEYNAEIVKLGIKNG